MIAELLTLFLIGAMRQEREHLRCYGQIWGLQRQLGETSREYRARLVGKLTYLGMRVHADPNCSFFTNSQVWELTNAKAGT